MYNHAEINKCTSRKGVKHGDGTNQILADPTFNKPGPMDGILGAKEYGEIILNGVNKSRNGILCQNIEFRWTVSGDTSEVEKTEKTVTSMIS